MKKRGIALALCLALLCAGCSGAKSSLDKRLISESVELGQEIAELSGDEGWCEMLGLSPEVLAEAQNFTALSETPRRALLLNLSDGLIEGLTASEDALEELSDEALAILERRITAGIGNVLVGQFSSNVWLAAAASFADACAFPKPKDWKGPVAVALVYDEVGLIVTFQETGENIVSASAIPVPTEAITTGMTQIAENTDSALRSYTRSELKDILD